MLALPDEADGGERRLMATVHVYPVNDLIEHELDGEACACGPVLEYVDGEEEDGWVVTHASLDGRETREKARNDDRPT